MKYVYTYGAFDLLHPGHIRFLEKARALGDILYVGIVDDESIRKLKGEGRPIQPQAHRKETVAAIKGVYAVYNQTTYNPIHMMKVINDMLGINHNIAILCKGDDWEHIPGKDWAEANGIEYISVPYSDEFSTSDLIMKIEKPAFNAGWEA